MIPIDEIPHRWEKNSLLEEVKDAITGISYDMTETGCGHSVRETVKNSFGRPGDNSFTWARNMLYSINDNRIIRDLPKKPLDLIASFANRHLKDNGSDDQRIKLTPHRY